MLYIITILLLFLTYKSFKMSEQLDAISANLDAANASLQKINADIAALNSQIQSADSLEALEAVKLKSAELVASLQATDDLTPEA